MPEYTAQQNLYWDKMIKQSVIDQIKSIVDEKRVRFDEPMKNHTTFRIGGNADVFVSIASEAEVKALVDMLKSTETPYYIIGNGSNLLVSDKGYRGVIIEIGRDYCGIRPDGNKLIVKAGTLLSKVSHYAFDHSLAGLEFASGIPGTVGGAIIMNAGAYGGEMKQVAESVKVMQPSGEIVVLDNRAMEFEYRNSLAKKKGYIVLEATFLLLQADKKVIEGVMLDLATRRREKQPLEYPSAGSTFKRPTGYYAGKLIADSGLKGYCVGDAQVSEKHAGFLINKGEATAADMYGLIKKVKAEVYDKMQVELEPEVIFLGDFE